MLRALLSLHAATALKVAVTGATGRLGRRAVEKLVAQGAAVRCLVRHEPAAVGDDAGSGPDPASAPTAAGSLSTKQRAGGHR